MHCLQAEQDANYFGPCQADPLYPGLIHDGLLAAHLLADPIHVNHLQLLEMHLCPYNGGVSIVLDLRLWQHHLQH